MNERKEVLKSVIYSVTPRGSIKTNKPSTVEMTVDHRFANKADELYQDIKEGLEPQGKLVRLELVAVWEEEEQVIDVDLKRPDLKLSSIENPKIDTHGEDQSDKVESMIEGLDDGAGGAE